jgi:hypothetical protein
VTDVERFFRRLVCNLAATDPARLRRPVPLDDITGSILPYRTNRRALQLDTVEDYEAVLLRLCAGEGDLVRTEPEEARGRFAQESRNANPDLTVLYSFEDVQVTFRLEPLSWALAPEPDAAFAPPSPDVEAVIEPEIEPEEEAALDAGRRDDLDAASGAELPGVESLREVPGIEEFLEADEPAEAGETPAEDPRPSCIYCGGALPLHRAVNFCPHCGQSQTQILCPECRAEIEPGWRHCVNCGAAVGEG